MKTKTEINGLPALIVRDGDGSTPQFEWLVMVLKPLRSSWDLLPRTFYK